MLNAQKIIEKAKKDLVKSWFVEKAGHNNIESDKKFKYVYFKKIKDFLHNIYKYASNL